MSSFRLLTQLLILSSFTGTILLRAASTVPAEPSCPPEQALKELLDGNTRFMANTPSHPHQSSERRSLLAGGQKPFAIVLTCADSRVAPEIYFDQGLGDLFVLRNAGNVLDDHVVGSIEYAIEHLHARLVVVVGHAQCGAVAATLAGAHAPGHIHSIVDFILPAAEQARKQQGDPLDNTVRAHATRVAAILSEVQPIVGPAVKAGEVKVVAARYDLTTGRVELLP